MKLYNINNPSETVDLFDAVFSPLAKDRGLYLPEEIPVLSDDFFNSLPSLSFQEIAHTVIHELLRNDLTFEEVKTIVNDAFDFPVPLKNIDDDTSILELFHGPTLAFKDFGARFMSRLMTTLLKKHNSTDKRLYILVATSGDTGGAVASGFLSIPNISVVILFPKGKVSALQQKQLTTHGENIHAFEIDGDFDDCQRIVKDAFTDENLNQNFLLSSANSINISRLIPQSLYYFEAYKQRKLSQPGEEDINMVVPSGNFGNLCGGLIAQRMGLPIKHFVAANNINDPVVKYLDTSTYTPQQALPTVSNAMDIGDPSNFPRILELLGQNIKDYLHAYSFSDSETLKCIKDFWKEHNYLLDPHTAVGILASSSYNRHTNSTNKRHNIVLSTAHPCKFIEETQPHTNLSCEIPQSASELFLKPEKKTTIPPSYEEFKKAFVAL